MTESLAVTNIRRANPDRWYFDATFDVEGVAITVRDFAFSHSPGRFLVHSPTVKTLGAWHELVKTPWETKATLRELVREQLAAAGQL
jgi:hypothetical protein